MHALDYLKSLKGIARAEIAIAAGLSPAYVSRMLCTRKKVDYCPLSLAIESAKHSAGTVDVLESLRSDKVDWQFLKTYLAEKH